MATHAHTEQCCNVWACVLNDDGTVSHSDNPERRVPVISNAERERLLMLSDDPRIWKPLRW
jgi:hypothetical protein